MFRSATTRIAHNSIVPGLAQAALSKDLKALQDLINAEKAVQQTLQKLAVDLGKASEAVKVWGNGEGDDLGDTLSSCTALLLFFASALSRFSNYEATVREQMKSVRTREEGLDEMKKRRKSLTSKADASDKKLNKMSAENKNFQAQADSLNKLREEIRIIDTEILNEEASLGDFKRTSAKNWMGMKLGALAECCEKGLIVSEMGKLVIAEIPQFQTEPGLPRPYYTGHGNTEALVAEARQRIDQVMFSTEAAPTSLNIRQLSGQESLTMMANTGIVPRQNSSQLTFVTAPPSLNSTPDPSVRSSQRYSQVILSPDGTSLMQLPEVSLGGLGMSSMLEADNFPPRTPRSPPPGSILSTIADPYAQSVPQTPHSQHADMGEFGMHQSQFQPRSSSLRNEQPPIGIPAGPRDARFGTFPLKGAGGPRPQTYASGSSSFNKPPRLDERAPSVEIERPDPNESFSSSVAEALGQQWASDGSRPSSTSNSGKMQEAAMHVRNRDYSPPPPEYSSVLDEPLETVQENAGPSTTSTQASTSNNPFDERNSRADLDEETGLAYMSSSPEDPVPLRAPSRHGQEDRRVRFGGPDNNIDSAEEDTPQPSRQATTIDDPIPSPPPNHDAAPQIPPVGSPPLSPRQPAPPAPAPLSSLAPSILHAPSEDEKALNAAAAREVSRELDALMFSSPLKPADPAPPPPRVDPLQVPQPPFVRRMAPNRSSVSLSNPIGSPTSSMRSEPSYVRERDRSGSVVSSPTSTTHHSPTNTSHSHSADGNEPQQPPSSILIPPVTTPMTSTNSTPYRTPMEFPAQPAGPGSFYNLPAMSGSGSSFTPGGARTISAAAFKRQIRSPSSPPVGGGNSLPDTTPLMVKKRLPASPSPYGSSRLQANDFPAMQRVSSASDFVYQRDSADSQSRSSSGTYASRQSGDNVQPTTSPSGPGGEHGEDDHYDYISAYVDDVPDSAQPTHGRGSGYNSGRFATSLEPEGGIR